MRCRNESATERPLKLLAAQIGRPEWFARADHLHVVDREVFGGEGRGEGAEAAKAAPSPGPALQEESAQSRRHGVFKFGLFVAVLSVCLQLEWCSVTRAQDTPPPDAPIASEAERKALRKKMEADLGKAKSLYRKVSMPSRQSSSNRRSTLADA